LLAAVLLGAVWALPLRAAPPLQAQDGVAEGETAVMADLYDMTQVPRRARKVLFRANGFVRRGNLERAVAVLDGFIADHPDEDHPLLELSLAQDLGDLGRLEEAMTRYRRAVSLQPALARGWYGLADAAYELERYAEAGEAFLQGFAVDPEEPAEVLSYAGTSYLLAEDFPRARQVFSRLIANYPQSQQLRWYQGLVAATVRAGKPEQAASAVEDVQLLYPEDPEMWYLKYQWCVSTGDYRSAAVALNIAGFLRPLRVEEQRQLGDLYTLVGVPELAASHYRAGLDDQAAAAQFERLVSSLVAAHELDEALATLDQALRRNETPTLVSLLGDIHYMRRDFRSAKVAYERLGEMDPDNGRAWLMRGYCALELGEKDDALDLLATASSYRDQSEMAQMLIQRALKM